MEMIKGQVYLVCDVEPVSNVSIAIGAACYLD